MNNSKVTVKFGAMVLVYRQIDYLYACLMSVQGIFDVILCMYTETPFSAYNPAARLEYGGNDGSLEILNALSKKNHGIKIIKGDWDSEEDMRTSAALKLKKFGVDYIFLLDADEFYPDGMLKNILYWISTHADSNSAQRYLCQFRNLYKYLDYEIINCKLYQTVCFPAIQDFKFLKGRTTNLPKSTLPSNFFFWHAGYVLSDERMYEKINTFSHAHELVKDWYLHKWLEWTPKTVNLGRKNADIWPRTAKVPYNELPHSLQTFSSEKFYNKYI